jgi:hypothetical protein
MPTKQKNVPPRKTRSQRKSWAVPAMTGALQRPSQEARPLTSTSTRIPGRWLAANQEFGRRRPLCQERLQGNANRLNRLDSALFIAKCAGPAVPLPVSSAASIIVRMPSPCHRLAYLRQSGLCG